MISDFRSPLHLVERYTANHSLTTTTSTMRARLRRTAPHESCRAPSAFLPPQPRSAGDVIDVHYGNPVRVSVPNRRKPSNVDRTVDATRGYSRWTGSSSSVSLLIRNSIAFRARVRRNLLNLPARRLMFHYNRLRAGVIWGGGSRHYCILFTGFPSLGHDQTSAETSEVQLNEACLHCVVTTGLRCAPCNLKIQFFFQYLVLIRTPFGHTSVSTRHSTLPRRKPRHII
jgi:hypothetical protein